VGAPSGAGRVLDSRVLTSPRLLTESSRRSSWLYWSWVTPIHTQVPSVSTRTTTASMETMTMVRSESIRVGSRCNTR
jgi:hypothetical protein